MKNLLKSGLSLIMALILVFSFAACGEKTEDDYVEFDVVTFTDDLEKNVKFDTVLDFKPSSTAGIYYPDLPKDENGALLVDAELWLGEDIATADLIILAKAKKEENVDKVVQWAEAKRDSLIETYSDYDAEEAAKIENAVIRKNGKFVVFIITNDYKTAQSIVDKHWTES